MSGDIVVVDNIVKIYRDGTKAVDGVTFKAGRGITILMGPNGSGKSTTLSIIAGALVPTSGKVLVCGHDVWGSGWDAARMCVGFAPQIMPFRERLTVIENLVWFGMIRGFSIRESKKRAKRLLEEVGLEEHSKKMVGQLSGGMRKKLSIIAALIGDPQVLILDEPTSGLDPAARKHLWDIIRRLAKEKTILVSTHIAEEAEQHGETVLIFHKGRIVAEGSPKDLIQKYAPESMIRVQGRLVGKAIVEGAELVFASESEARYLSRDPEHVLPALIEEIIALGGVPELVEVRKPGLQEVFYRLTGVELEEGV